LGIFQRAKKNCNGHFAVRFLEDARQSDQNQQHKQCLCRAFIGAHGKGVIDCRAFWASAHGKEPIFAVRFFSAHGKEPIFAVRFFLAHGKGHHTPSHPGAVSCFFFFAVRREKRTAKIIYRALSEATHGKGALPCKMLPCALCRAPRRKMHGKGFSVCSMAFAVRPWRTAKPLFPVVVEAKSGIPSKGC
jgi:hypothetical protein